MKDPVLAIFMRTDLNMSRGKIAVQAGHAVALSMYDQFYDDSNLVVDWMQENQVKIILSVNNLEDLKKIGEMAEKNNVPYHYVSDMGKTEVPTLTITCLAVGIAARNRVNKITAGWKALK